MGEVACNDLPQPVSLSGDSLVHSSPQLRLDFLQLGPHAVAPGLPLKLEGSPSRFAADEHKTQEPEGLRLAEPALLAVLCRKAAELDQAGLIRMKRQRELPQPVAHRIPEAPGVTLVLEANDSIVGVPDHDHVTRGLAPSPALGPEVENVVEVDVRE